MAIESIGYGAGDKDFPDRANMLRLVIGESSSAPEATEISVIEANIDDMSPEWAGYARTRLLEEGALDVTLTPSFMKKDRPGYVLTVLAKPADRDRLGDVLFAETTTLGIRYYAAQRRVLDRDSVAVSTPYGEVRVKVASDAGQVRNFAPEFDDCRRLAEEKKVPLKQVWHAANLAYQNASDGAAKL